MAKYEFAALPAVRDEVGFRAFLTQLDGYFAQVGYGRSQLEWAQKMHELSEPDARAELDAASDQLYTQRNHEVIREWGARAEESMLRRWAEVLDRKFVMARMEQEPDLRKIVHHISDRYRDWRPTLDGRQIPYAEQTLIFRFDTDRAKRERAWMAQWDLNRELEGITREMFAMRNERARALGYATYAELSLAFNEIDRPWLVGLIDEMERVTGPDFQGYLGEQAARYGIADPQPWDIQFLFDGDPWPDVSYFPADKLQPNLYACAAALGQDNDNTGIRVFWYDSPYGGQCVTYSPRDVRILTNQGNGMLYYHTAYHEYGHAIHSWYYDVPYTLRNESGMFTEGMAQFMALFLHYPSWLRRTGVPDDVIQRYRATRKLPWMYRHRRIVADVLAELAVWDNPNVDFDRAYGESTARFLGVAYHPRPFAAVPRWTMPVRMHSYFIADLISTQTHAYLRANVKPIFGARDALEHARRHYWAPGNTIPWREKIRNCTGEELTYRFLGIEMTDLLPDG